MYPILFKIGPFSIHTFGLLHTLAFFAGIWWVYREAKQEGVDSQHIGDLMTVIFFLSLIGARGFSVLFDGNLKWYLQHLFARDLRPIRAALR